MPPQSDDKGNIDIEKILLPKKEVRTPLSASRINAGALLEQEQKAAAAGFTKEKPLPPTQAEAGPPTPKKEEATVKPLQTYQADVESLVEKKNISAVSIAAAEANKRPVASTAVPIENSWLTRGALVAGGVAFIAAAVGLGVWVFTRQNTVEVVPLNTAAPFITVDDTKEVQVEAGSRQSVLAMLDQARQGTLLSLGLIARLYVTVPAVAAEGQPAREEMHVQDLLRVLAPDLPGALLRTLTGAYLLGVHSFDENQTFLIVRVDSYEVAYAGMLAWETTMAADLSPLFLRTPPVREVGAATTTPQTAVVAGAFVDRVVENHDARVLQNQNGDITLLWTFLDRNTIVIATNEFALREIISRITTPPSQGLPQ